MKKSSIEDIALFATKSN